MTPEQISDVVAQAIKQANAASDARSVALGARISALETEIDLMTDSTPQYRALRRHFPPLEETPQ
jgi:hypothetical protein